jgi:hypothetical protein
VPQIKITVPSSNLQTLAINDGDVTAFDWLTPAVLAEMTRAVTEAIAEALMPIQLSVTRLQNASATQPWHALAEPPGRAVPNFPPTVSDLVSLSAVAATALQEAYQLQPGPDDSLLERRQAIATYLGVRILL